MEKLTHTHTHTYTQTHATSWLSGVFWCCPFKIESQQRIPVDENICISLRYWVRGKRKLTSGLGARFQVVCKTKAIWSDAKVSYWIWELPRFSNSFYPSLAVRFRAGSKFVLALVFSPIGNRKTMLQQMKTDCNFLRSVSTEIWEQGLIGTCGPKQQGPSRITKL
jgi:hypothetical protein